MEDIQKSIKKEEITTTINKVLDSYVVDSGIMPFVRSLPVIGDMISTTMNKALSDFQEKKQKELLNCILEDNQFVTTDSVNDVEFLINLVKSVEAVNRLATNDKVKYFGALLRNGYLSNQRISGSDFEEFSGRINTLSFKELEYLSFIKLHSDVNRKIGTTSNEWKEFCDLFCERFGCKRNEVVDIFTRLERTGFISEEYKTDTGEVDDNQVEELIVNSDCYVLTKSFDDFCNYVLNIK